MVTPFVSTAPPADITQSVVTIVEPWAVTPSLAIEFDITLQPVRVRLELPENSIALDADLSSASMQALASVLKLAIALALVAIGDETKIWLKKRFSVRVSSTFTEVTPAALA